MRKTIIITAVLIVILVVAFLVFDIGRKPAIAPGINATTTDVQIVVSYPEDNQEVLSPIKISGKARGNWFFEGSFPIQLVDANGNILGTSIATSSEDWMTTEFINFNSEMSFEKSTSTRRAVLVLKKDNPSGISDFDQSVFVRVILK
ncbi:MAG: Gmad2 immunoglobulin-like domain-containing protein [bacterium]